MQNKVVNTSNQNKENIAKRQLELKRKETRVPISSWFKSCIWLVEKVAWVSGQITRWSKAKLILFQFTSGIKLKICHYLVEMSSVRKLILANTHHLLETSDPNELQAHEQKLLCLWCLTSPKSFLRGFQIRLYSGRLFSNLSLSNSRWRSFLSCKSCLSRFKSVVT